MASAKPVSPVRGRTSGSSGSAPGKGAGPEISGARWAGIALVIASLLGAVALAVFSPSDGQAPVSPSPGIPSTSPSPLASVLETRVPTARPQITSPKTGWLVKEWYIDVVVKIPEEKLPRRILELVILRDDQEIGRLPRPDTGGSVTLEEVELVAGENVLTAALRTVAGRGPASESVTVTQDRNAPDLEITSPATATETIEDSVSITGTSEAGVSVTVENPGVPFETTMGVGPSGEFEVNVPLDLGRNRITVRSTNDAGMDRQDTVIVVRADGRPRIATFNAPKSVARSELPTEIRVVVEVTDAKGEEIEDAIVSYSLGGLGWTGQRFEDRSDGNGRSVWEVELVPSGAGNDPSITVEVIAPNRERAEANKVIAIR
jgi:hypothetical protein